MPHQYRVLVIDDDSDALDMLQIILRTEGFDVKVARDGHSGLRAAYEMHPDIILLDIMMPRMDGFEACRRLREMTEAPIIFVTAKCSLDDMIQGLSLGADDYVVKPYNRRELLGRLAACLRRSKKEDTDDDVEVIFATDSVMLNCDHHELVIGDQSVYLTPTEFEVLRLMIRHIGKVLSKDAILTRVWGPEWIGEADLVKQYIYRLRQKIEPDQDSCRYIHTVRGRGYYFDIYDLS